MAVSGHKNEASIRSYPSNISEHRSREISNALTIVSTDQRPIEKAVGSITRKISATRRY